MIRNSNRDSKRRCLNIKREVSVNKRVTGSSNRISSIRWRKRLSF
jgi:hypothetical protein